MNSLTASWPVSTATTIYERVLSGRSDIGGAPPLPTIVLRGELSDKWQLVQPIQLEIDSDEGDYIVAFDLLHAYGTGENFHEAVGDFVAMLLDQHEDLIESEASLGPGLRRLLETYRAYLAPL